MLRASGFEEEAVWAWRQFWSCGRVHNEGAQHPSCLPRSGSSARIRAPRPQLPRAAQPPAYVTCLDGQPCLGQQRGGRAAS